MRFILIHGGFHGAWCWVRTIEEFERLGHEAIAIDLPGHGHRRDERSTLADRRDAIIAVMQPFSVLVGHSGGGFDITLAADAMPANVRHLIYLAAGVPVEGRTINEVAGGEISRQADGKEEITRLTSQESGMQRFIRRNAQGRMECFDYAAVRNYFYHDCDEDTARWAYDHLTPQPLECLVEKVSVPRFWEADLPRSFILCLQDRGGGRFLHKGFAERLGVHPLTIDSSHSPFLSRPRELAELMVHATTTAPDRPLRPH